jgi:hypothetical protein
MAIFTFNVPAGQVATFTASTAATVTRLADSPGSSTQYSPVSVSAAASLAIGPHAEPRRYQYDSDNAGSVAYTLADLATSAADALKLSKAADDALAEGVDIALGTTTGSKIGTATAQKLAFHNSTPVIQRAGAAQAAVVDTGATAITPYGYTEAQANAIIALVNELRAALVEKGIIKGAA